MRNRGNRESGFSLIELMIAGVVLTVGFLALIGLIITAIGNNYRSRTDTSGVLLAQSVIEEIKHAITSNPSTSEVKDCDGTPWLIDSSIGGATLSGSTIDYSQDYSAIDEGYRMYYVVCSGNQRATYDVRWNIVDMRNDDYVSGNLVLVTIGAKLRSPNTNTNLKLYSLPFNLRAYVGE